MIIEPLPLDFWMNTEDRDLAGCCGLFCGICPRYQSKAPSRCPGCQLGEQHSYCSIYRCCQRKGVFTCAECDQFPCERLLRVLGVERGLDSFVSHRPAIPNLEKIREIGLEAHLGDQGERRRLVEELIAGYNDGRSMTFFCSAGALLPPGKLGKTLKAIREETREEMNPKGRARLARKAIGELARVEDVDLRLRRSGGGN